MDAHGSARAQQHRRCGRSVCRRGAQNALRRNTRASHTGASVPRRNQRLVGRGHTSHAFAYASGHQRPCAIKPYLYGKGLFIFQLASGRHKGNGRCRAVTRNNGFCWRRVLFGFFGHLVALLIAFCHDLPLYVLFDFSDKFADRSANFFQSL